MRHKCMKREERILDIWTLYIETVVSPSSYYQSTNKDAQREMAIPWGNGIIICRSGVLLSRDSGRVYVMRTGALFQFFMDRDLVLVPV